VAAATGTGGVGFASLSVCGSEFGWRRKLAGRLPAFRVYTRV